MDVMMAMQQTMGTSQGFPTMETSGNGQSAEGFAALFQQYLGGQGIGQQIGETLPMSVDASQVLDPQELMALQQLVECPEESAETDIANSDVISQLQVLLGQLQTLFEQVQQPELTSGEFDELYTEFKGQFDSILKEFKSSEDQIGFEKDVQDQFVDLTGKIEDALAQLQPYLPVPVQTANMTAVAEENVVSSKTEAKTVSGVSEKKQNVQAETSDDRVESTSADDAIQIANTEEAGEKQPGQDKGGSQQKSDADFAVDETMTKVEKFAVQKEAPREDAEQPTESTETPEVGTKLTEHMQVSQDENGDSSEKNSHSNSPQQTIEHIEKKAETLTPRVNVAERIQQHTSVHQVAHKIQYMVHNGEGRAILRLDPPELGHIEIQVESSPGEMRVQMKVENESVKQIMESSVSGLRESLEQQNVKLEKLEVQVDQSKADAQAKGQENLFRQKHGNKGGRGTRFAEVIVEQPQSDTGRRLGYNTMELIA